MLRNKYMVIAALAILLCSGCANVESVRGEVLADRTRAYGKWLKARKDSGESKTILKGDLSLQDAVKLALANNKSLLAVAEEKEIARGRIVESYSGALPKLTATGRYTKLDEASSFDVGGQNVSLGFEDNYSTGFEVKQPLYRGGAIGAAIRAAAIYACLSDETVRDKVQDTIYEVAKAYFEVLLAGHLYEANKQALRSAESHRDDVKEKFAQGVASRLDAMRAEVDVSNFKAETIRQDNRIKLAKTGLLKLMGVSQESDILLSDELTYETVETDIEEAVRLAFENRPDLRRAELSVRLQEEDLRVARSKYLPEIDLTFNQNWANPDPHNSTEDEWGDAWTAGVTVRWPLFDGMKREGRVQRKKAALRQEKIQLADTEERALLEIQRAVLNLRSAVEFVGSQGLNRAKAQEALRLVEVGYREGVNSEVEVTDGRAAFTKAVGLYYQAVYDHKIARLDLQKAVGALGPAAVDNNREGEKK